MIVARSLLVGLLTVAAASCGSSDDSSQQGSSEPIAPPTSPPGASAPVPAVADGLALCADVPVVTTDVVGTNVGGGNPDPIFEGVVLTYIEEHRDVYGGHWIDREAGGTFVVAFTDDPKPHLAALRERRPSPNDVHSVEPPPEITDDRPIGEWGVPFDVVQVAHTDAELMAANTAAFELLSAAGVAIDGLGTDVLRNRVSIYAAGPITPADVAEIEAVLTDADVPLDRVCLDATVVEELPTPIEPGSELDVIVLPDETGAYPADTPVECGFMRFELGDLAVMTPVEDVDPGLRAVVDGWLSNAEGQHWPQDGWMLLTEDGERATLVRIDETGMWSIEAEMGRNGWIWSGAGGAAQCDVKRLLPAGLGTVEWELDPAFPTPGPDATELHLLATERACTGGSEAGERLLGPQVVETGDAVRIAFAAIPLTGEQTCPGNPPTAVTVTLSAPLGDRALLDGLVVGPLSDLLP